VAEDLVFLGNPALGDATAWAFADGVDVGGDVIISGNGS
jgi:hypothetical protein